MNLRRFSAIISSYGADPARWPEAERATAEAFVRSSDDAARLLSQAHRLDDMLAGSHLGRGSPTLHDLGALQFRILAGARPIRTSFFERWFGFELTPVQIWPSLAGLALATVLGFGVGLGGLLQSDTERYSDDLTLSQIDYVAAGQ